jgi:hypothetical protein
MPTKYRAVLNNVDGLERPLQCFGYTLVADTIFIIGAVLFIANFTALTQRLEKRWLIVTCGVVIAIVVTVGAISVNHLLNPGNVIINYSTGAGTVTVPESSGTGIVPESLIDESINLSNVRIGEEICVYPIQLSIEKHLWFDKNYVSHVPCGSLEIPIVRTKTGWSARIKNKIFQGTLHDYEFLSLKHIKVDQVKLDDGIANRNAWER